LKASVGVQYVPCVSCSLVSQRACFKGVLWANKLLRLLLLLIHCYFWARSCLAVLLCPCLTVITVCVLSKSINSIRLKRWPYNRPPCIRLLPVITWELIFVALLEIRSVKRDICSVAESTELHIFHSRHRRAQPQTATDRQHGMPIAELVMQLQRSAKNHTCLWSTHSANSNGSHLGQFNDTSSSSSPLLPSRRCTLVLHLTSLTVLFFTVRLVFLGHLLPLTSYKSRTIWFPLFPHSCSDYLEFSFRLTPFIRYITLFQAPPQDTPLSSSF